VTIGKKQNKDRQGMKSARKSASQGYYDRLRPEQDKNNKRRDRRWQAITSIKRTMEIMGTPGGHVMVLGILDIEYFLIYFALTKSYPRKEKYGSAKEYTLRLKKNVVLGFIICQKE
jgi:hypothetical protein